MKVDIYKQAMEEVEEETNIQYMKNMESIKQVAAEIEAKKMGFKQVDVILRLFGLFNQPYFSIYVFKTAFRFNPSYVL